MPGNFNIEDPNFKAWSKGAGRLRPGGGSGGGGGIAPMAGNYSNTPLANIQDPSDPYGYRKRRADYLTGGTTGAPMVPQGNVNQQYLGGADRVNNAAGQFSYTPDMADPELLALRSRAMRGQQQRTLQSRDEYARAGLLGSGTMISGLDNQQRGYQDDLQGIDQGVFANRRLEALGQYNKDLDYRRVLESARLNGLSEAEMMKLQAHLQDRNQFGDLLGTAGSLVGGAGYDYLSELLKARARGRN